MATAPTQPDPAEGPREDEPATENGANGAGEVLSPSEPAEGADDAPGGGSGSPD